MGFIDNLYRWYANTLFRHLFTPEDGIAFFTNRVWKSEIFTHLFILFILVSLIIGAVYYFYLNGSKAPAVFSKNGHWWNALLVGLVLNALIAGIYLSINKLPGGNHLFCLATANALFGTIAFIMVSFIMQFKSPSANGIPSFLAFNKK